MKNASQYRVGQIRRRSALLEDNLSDLRIACRQSFTMTRQREPARLSVGRVVEPSARWRKPVSTGLRARVNQEEQWRHASCRVCAQAAGNPGGKGREAANFTAPVRVV